MLRDAARPMTLPVFRSIPKSLSFRTAFSREEPAVLSEWRRWRVPHRFHRTEYSKAKHWRRRTRIRGTSAAGRVAAVRTCRSRNGMPRSALQKRTWFSPCPGRCEQSERRCVTTVLNGIDFLDPDAPDRRPDSRPRLCGGGLSVMAWLHQPSVDSRSLAEDTRTTRLRLPRHEPFTRK
jgi:hypothetical protein